MQLGFIGKNDLAGLEEDCAFARQYGLRGLEFNYWADFAQLDEPTVRGMKALLDRYGLACTTLGLWGWNHIAADDAVRSAAHGHLDRAIAFGELLGAPTLILGGGERPGAGLEAQAQVFATEVRPYVDRAAGAGMKVALYGFHGGFLMRQEAYEALWRHLPEVGVKYDAANIDHVGQDYLKLLRDHPDKIYHVHLKEHMYHGLNRVASQPAVGMGDIQWGKIMACLYEADYQGYLVIEPHSRPWATDRLRYTMIRLSAKYISQFLLDD